MSLKPAGHSGDRSLTQLPSKPPPADSNRKFRASFQGQTQLRTSLCNARKTEPHNGPRNDLLHSGIEGDNLEVLKLLQKSYLGKVKMIYIDPPYNTGNDFIYPDNYAESLQTYLEYTGQADTEGRKFGTNTEADGRFHSKWLCMMYTHIGLND